MIWTLKTTEHESVHKSNHGVLHKGVGWIGYCGPKFYLTDIMPLELNFINILSARVALLEACGWLNRQIDCNAGKN